MPPNTHDHLTLRLSRLKAGEEFEQKVEGLTFLFSKGGSGKYRSQLATFQLAPGDLLVFNSAAGSKVAVLDGQAGFLFWTFSVCFENLLPLFAGREISLLHKISDGYKAGKVYPASAPLTLDCQRLMSAVPDQFNLDHRGQLLRIAATILSAEFKDALSQRTGQWRPDDHMVQTFERLSASELISLSVGELADRFRCSRRHLNRLFHQHFGVSVAALRMEMRLLKAISLLRDVNAKIINVAEECGFNHLGLFNTCFKRRFGTSPGQWRKATLQAECADQENRENNPACPLHCAGLCPLNVPREGNAAIDNHNAAPGGADGKNVLDDLKRRALAFGAHPLTGLKHHLVEARGHA